MSNLTQKLTEKIKQQQQTANMTAFNGVLVTYLGAQPKPFYPKLKDQTGQSIKDDNGRDKRSDVIAGYTYTFSEVGTSKIVKVVLKQVVNDLKLLSLYEVSGRGYDIRQSSMIFMELETGVKPYEIK